MKRLVQHSLTVDGVVELSRLARIRLAVSCIIATQEDRLRSSIDIIHWTSTDSLAGVSFRFLS
jgi:hypothetical protein